MFIESLKLLNEQTATNELAAVRAAEVEDLIEAQLFDPSLSFAYASKKNNTTIGCISGKWFRNPEKYSLFFSPSEQKACFHKLVNAGIWSAFYSAEVMLSEHAEVDTARALVSLGLTESNKYGIPLLVGSSKDTAVVPALFELGFKQFDGPKVVVEKEWIIERSSKNTANYSEQERDKVLFVNRY